MKYMQLILALGTCALLAAGSTAFAQENNDGYLLEITKVGVKIGHDMKFNEDVKAYHQCLVEREYEGAWSAWSNVGGKGREYHFVSTMDNWAELDSVNEAVRACWSEHHDSLTSHARSVETYYARHMADWSGDAEGYSVVRLHQFRVKDGRAFRETVGTIAGTLKEAEYPQMGNWYNVMGNDSTEPDYFVVVPYNNFAAMDDSTSPYEALVEAAGEARAEELWEQFGNSLRDDSEYFTALLRREDDLSYSGED